MRVAIRTDASTDIGTGHVMRCLALAEELRSSGHDVVFVTRPSPGNLDGVVRDGWTFEVASIRPASDLPPLACAGTERQTEDADATREALSGTPIDWLVVDHYSLSSPWERRAGAAGTPVLVIDDLANRDHACTVLVDHNLLPEDRYRDVVSPDCQLLVGPRYALLRCEFRGIAKRRAIPAAPRTLLLSFGGADPTDRTGWALEALLDMATDLPSILVVAGAHHPNMGRLRKLAEACPAIELYEHVPRMSEFLARADIAIGAGGVATLERLSAGLPSIVVSVAENQEHISEALARDSLIVYLGPSSVATAQALCNAVSELAPAEVRRTFAWRGPDVVDGFGTQRVARRMAQLARVVP